MTDFSTPQLVVTNVGLAVASQATPVGPFVHITGFRIGSAYGYNPQPTDTNINGNLLYQGVPTSYRYMGDNTLAVICEMPATVGPFEFGEVAIDLDGGVMFAKAAFATPQTKFTSLNTNVLSTYTFNCLIKLEQSVAVFQVNTLCGPPDILEVDAWTDVLPPFQGGTTSLTPALIVKEPTPNGESTMIFQSNDHHWTIGAPYQHAYIGPCQPSSNVSVTIKVADLLNFDPTVIPDEYVTGRARDFVIEDDQGNIRAVSSSVLTTAGPDQYLSFTLTAPFPSAPATGSNVFIHTVKPLTHVKLSTAAGNLIEKRADGLYYGITAPPNLQDIYIDAVNGSNSNPGTRAQPMQTIQAALALGSQGLNRNIYLYEQQTHYVDPNNSAIFRGGNWILQPYGPQCDQLPPVPGDSHFLQVAAQGLAPTIQGLGMKVVSGPGYTLQFAPALYPADGAFVIAFATIFKCSPPSTGDTISSMGTFQEPYSEGQWFLRNCYIDTNTANSSFGNNYVVAPFQIQNQFVKIVGPGKLFYADNTSMTLSNRGGFLGSWGMSDADLLSYVGNAASAAPLFYNFNTNMKPTSSGGAGNLQKVTVPNVANYTMPADRIGYYQLIIDDRAGGDHNNRFMYVNGVQIGLMDTADACGFMSTMPMNPGDNVQMTGDIGGGSTRAFVMMYPPGVTAWN